MRKINIKTDSTLKYFQVFNGILELTDKKLVSKRLNIKDPNTLNNYVKRLKDKGAITKTKDGYALAGLLKKEEYVVLAIHNV